MIDQSTIATLSQFFKLMSDSTRLSILYLLNNHELNVSQISEELQIEQSVVSHHLQKLRMGRIVKSRREGKMIYYSHDDEHIKSLLAQSADHIKERVY